MSRPRQPVPAKLACPRCFCDRRCPEVLGVGVPDGRVEPPSCGPCRRTRTDPSPETHAEPLIPALGPDRGDRGLLYRSWLSDAACITRPPSPMQRAFIRDAARSNRPAVTDAAGMASRGSRPSAMQRGYIGISRPRPLPPAGLPQAPGYSFITDAACSHAKAPETAG